MQRSCIFHNLMYFVLQTRDEGQHMRADKPVCQQNEAAVESLSQLPLSRRMQTQQNQELDGLGLIQPRPEPNRRLSAANWAGGISTDQPAAAAQICKVTISAGDEASKASDPVPEELSLSQMPLRAWPDLLAGQPQKQTNKKAERRPSTANSTVNKMARKAQELAAVLDDPDLSQRPLRDWPIVKPAKEVAAANPGKNLLARSLPEMVEAVPANTVQICGNEGGASREGASHCDLKEDCGEQVAEMPAAASTSEEAAKDTSRPAVSGPQKSAVPWHASLIAEVAQAARSSGSGPDSETLRLAGAGLLRPPGDNQTPAAAKPAKQSLDRGEDQHVALPPPLQTAGECTIQPPVQAAQVASSGGGRGSLQAGGPTSTPASTVRQNAAGMLYMFGQLQAHCYLLHPPS